MRQIKQRSLEQHNRFFAVLSALYANWPEAHEFQPDNEDHLRAWLLVKAKHRVIADFHLGEVSEEYTKAIPAIAMAMFRKHVWAWQAGGSLRVCAAKSISIYGKEAIGHQEFCSVNDAVDDVIRAETGLDPDRLLRQQGT